ncbi:MAG: preprotein translocase subunit SecY [Armatimonadetes bacterium]|nr:preprotein translocase subunit SecY [Armatimonadota bacterium]
MLNKVAQATKAQDLRNRLLFMLGMFAVYVVGLHIPIPGIDHNAMNNLVSSGAALELLDVFSGGAFKRFTIFAMGIMPYINASIIMSLLTMAVPYLEKLQKEGDTGRKEIAKITRYMTVGLAFIQAFGVISFLHSYKVLSTRGNQYLQMLLITIVLVAGTSFLMWLGEMITDKGIGNGVSLIIFLGIVASLPVQITNTAQLYSAGSVNGGQIALLLVILLGTVAAIVAVTMAQRRIPIQHVKRVIGNRMTSGASSYLPLRVNSAGVIPIIFAISIQLFPQTIAQFMHGRAFGDVAKTVADFLSPGNWFGGLTYFLLVVAFTYFYTAVTFNVQDVSDNLKKWGSYVPGIRPGKPTTEYLDRVMTRITLVGAIFLGLIAMLPYWTPEVTGVRSFGLVGGTSLLILVGVALETMQAIEAQLVMRHYEGFIK